MFDNLDSYEKAQKEKEFSFFRGAELMHTAYIIILNTGGYNVIPVRKDENLDNVLKKYDKKVRYFYDVSISRDINEFERQYKENRKKLKQLV